MQAFPRLREEHGTSENRESWRQAGSAREGWWERAHCTRGEWWEGKLKKRERRIFAGRFFFLPFPSLLSPPLSSIINSNIPEKSDRERLETRQPKCYPTKTFAGHLDDVQRKKAYCFSRFYCMFLFLLSIDSCMDKNGNCPLWAKDGHCQSNPGYMNTNCRHSCKVCGGRNCRLCLLRVIEPRDRTGFNESVHVSYFSVRSSGSSPYPLLVTCTVVGISIKFF